jgi:hypothetical protein
LTKISLIQARNRDKAWAILGQQAAEKMKPIFGETANLRALQQSGKIAASVHGIEYNESATENEIRSEYVKCPWQDAYLAMDIASDWRLCASGHMAFTENMCNGLNPDATYKLAKNMPAADQICEGVTSI